MSDGPVVIGVSNSPTIYLPNEIELMVARNAIFTYVNSIANGNLKMGTDALNAIITRTVVSMRWRPQ